MSIRGKKRNAIDAGDLSMNTSQHILTLKKTKESETAHKGMCLTKQHTETDRLLLEEVEIQRQRLSSDFRMLELVLNSHRASGKVAVWERIRESMQQLTTRSFALADLIMVVGVWPEGLQFNWRNFAPDSGSAKAIHLCISANLSLATGEQTGGTLTQKRINHFDALLTQWIDNNPGVLFPACGMDVIPAQPTIGDSSAKGHSRNRNSSLLSCLTASELEELKERNRIAVSSDRGVAAVPGGIEQLRLLAVEREKASQQRCAELMQEKERVSSAAIFKSLPSLCNTLRAMALSRNKRNTFIMADLLRDLVLGLQVDGAELKTRLVVIATELPEFLTILPPDERVPVETVRVNLLADYGRVRSKLITLADLSKDQQ